MKFSIRDLLLVTVIVALAAALIGARLRSRWQNDELSRLGGQPLINRGGILEPQKQYGLRLAGDRCDNATIGRALRLADALGVPHQTIVLDNTRVSDAGVTTLCDTWGDVRDVFIIGENVSDVSVAQLRRLPRLEYLDANGAIFKRGRESP